MVKSLCRGKVADRGVSKNLSHCGIPATSHPTEIRGFIRVCCRDYAALLQPDYPNAHDFINPARRYRQWLHADNRPMIAMGRNILLTLQ
jgi:hypothetical protein